MKLPSDTFFEESDLDNSQLLISTYINNIKYATDSQSWFYWKDNKWVADDSKGFPIISNLWTGLAQQMPKYVENPRAKEPGTMMKFEWRQYSLSARGVRACLDLAKNDPKIQVKRSDFDAQPYQINTPAGPIDLRTGLLQSKEKIKAGLHTKETRCQPSKGNNGHPLWDSFLKDVFQGDQELIDYMQRLMGLTLIGEIVEQIMPFAQGEGGSGKGTFFNTIFLLLGDYAQSQMSTLITKSMDNKKETIANLQGTRLVLMSEIAQNSVLDEPLLKQLTGDDPLNGKFLYQRSFSFLPSHTLILFGNSKPRALEGGTALWRRFRLIPFNKKYEASTDNKRLRHELIEQEGPQIFQWLIEGTQKYLEHGLETPASVALATFEYEQEEDTLGEFLRDCCDIGTEKETTSKILYDTYKGWCAENGYKPMASNRLTRSIREHKKGRSGNISTYSKSGKARMVSGITVKMELQPDDNGIVIKGYS